MQNIKNWIIKNKFLVIFVIFLLMISVIYFIVTSGRKKPTEPTVTLFRLEKVLPPQGEQETAFPTTAIAFYFSAPINMDTLEVNISPRVTYDTSAENEDLVLYVIPSPAWRLNTEYTIRLNVQSKDGQQLEEAIVHKFKFKVPVFSPLTE